MPKAASLRGPALVAAIRDQIISGRLEPGSRVTEPTLATYFGVSRVPVREAVRALAAEGFVDLRPYGSPTVRELTPEMAREVRVARALLEPHTAREAALNRTDDDLAVIEAILVEGEEAIAEARLEKLHRLNSRFHDAVATACGNAVLGGFVHQLSYRSEWINSSTISTAGSHLWDEHRDIAAAIAARHGELAGTLMAAHVHRAATQPESGTLSEGRDAPMSLPASPAV